MNNRPTRTNNHFTPLKERTPMVTRKQSLTLSVAAALLVFGGQASAAVITPTSATSTTTIGGSRTITAAIDSTGLTDVSDPGSVLDDLHDGGGSNTHYLSDAGVASGGLSTTEVLTFDLGGAFNVDTIYYWAYNRPEEERGIKTFDIAFSTNGGSSYSAAVSAASLGMADWTKGTTSSSQQSSVDTRSITNQVGVTNIRLTNIQNFGGDRIALAEIRFGGVVPEPGSLALLGLGGLCVLRRRRNSRK